MKTNKTFGPQEYGCWVIYGEDPNCDFGGHHHEPVLAYVEGYYNVVVDYAAELPGFTTWGAGGRVEKIKVAKVNDVTNARRTSLKKQKEELESQIKTLDKELDQL